jgi:hypothetical protein
MEDGGRRFPENCVFMDQAGFNSHQIRNRGWAKIGETPMVQVPPNKGVNISIIDVFLLFELSKSRISSTKNAPQIEKEFPQLESKKRKAKRGNSINSTKVKKGTTAYYIVRFVHQVMDTLDKHKKKGFYIVMHNCRVHHSAFVVEAIEKRGYKPLFLHPTRHF